MQNLSDAIIAPMTAVPLLSRALYEEVAELLRQRIFSRELPPGAWIDELKIAEELGISTGAVGRILHDARKLDEKENPVRDAC